MARVCVVCAAPLNHFNFAGHGTASGAKPRAADSTGCDLYPTCHAVACRMVASRRADMGEPGFKYYLQRQATEVQGRQKQSRAMAARSLRCDQENARGWAALEARVLAGTVAPLRLVLPAGPRRTQQMRQQRRAAYQVHLKTILAEARQHSTAPAVPAGAPAVEPAITSTLPGRLCGLCGGGCCTRGADHAYLKVDTVRGLLEQHPALSDQEIIAAYLELLPARSKEGSCINHTSTGCALPRQLRSAVCNRYACESLGKLQHALQGAGGVESVLVVKRSLDNWQQSRLNREDPMTVHAVLTEQGLRRVELPNSVPDAMASLPKVFP